MYFSELFNLLREASEMPQDEMGQALADIIEDCLIEDVRTFQEDGVMSQDEGYTVYISDGRQFQVTIVQTK